MASRMFASQEDSDNDESWYGITLKWAPVAAASVGILIILCCLPLVYEWNNDEHYQILEYPDGGIAVIDTTGYHLQYFGEVFTYPRYLDMTDEPKVQGKTTIDNSVRVTFNDGGWGNMSNHLKIQLPSVAEKRIALHQHFGRSLDKGIEEAVMHHLINCLKNTGPLMSGSEHQSQRKAEFYQVVSDQLTKGLYVMERVKQEVERTEKSPNSTDDHDVQYITRIKRNPDGTPVMAAPSPLTEYGISVVQYNQTNTVYDKDTETQISAKRNSYQLAEEAKAGVEKEHQMLQEVIGKGRLAVASIEAEELKTKKSTLVKAQQELDVKSINQQEQVTIAEQAVAVAGESLKQQTTELETSKIAVDIAKADAKALIALSKATNAKIAKGGSLSEKDKMLAEMRMRRNAAIAESIAKIPSPKTVIFNDGKGGGAAAASGASTQETLMSLIMLQELGKNKNNPSAKVEEKK